MILFSTVAESSYLNHYRTGNEAWTWGHQAIEKTKSLLREEVWYPGMDDKVKKMIENCAACQAVGPSNSPEPMRITPTAIEPWQNLAIDFYGPVPRSGQYLLVVIDTYSKFPEVEIVKST